MYSIEMHKSEKGIFGIFYLTTFGNGNSETINLTLFGFLYGCILQSSIE